MSFATDRTHDYNHRSCAAPRAADIRWGLAQAVHLKNILNIFKNIFPHYLVQTPGRLGSAHPMPQLIMPARNQRLSSLEWTTRGPPESPQICRYKPQICRYKPQICRYGISHGNAKSSQYIGRSLDKVMAAAKWLVVMFYGVRNKPQNWLQNVKK